jgi:hypothetical protein
MPDLPYVGGPGGDGPLVLVVGDSNEARAVDRALTRAAVRTQYSTRRTPKPSICAAG